MNSKSILSVSVLYLCLSLTLFGCTVYQTPTPSPTIISTPVEEIDKQELVSETNETAEVKSTQEEEQIITTPTPAPTATPGPIDILISDVAERTGANRAYIFGLSVEDWVNLLISLVLVLFGIYVVSRIIIHFLKKAADKAPTPWAGEFIELTKPQIRWFIAVLFFQFATNRLSFLSAETKQLLNQVYFSLYLIIITFAIWKLIDLGEKWYEERRGETEGKDSRAEEILPLLKRILRGILLVVSAVIILDQFGVNVTALTAALGIAGLALSLAAQDSLADMINGLIILVDQPFKVGDRIEIEALNTWGDVVEIGTRTTRIRTLDNRMVIVPNSTIGKSQIVNYTYPSTQYRVQIEIGVSFESDLAQVKEIIIDSVSSVEGVLMDKPIDALFLEFGDTSMIIRVRWWIESYVDTRRMFDKVNTKLKEALTDAGVEMPFTTYNINIRKYDNVVKEDSNQDVSL